MANLIGGIYYTLNSPSAGNATVANNQTNTSSSITIPNTVSYNSTTYNVTAIDITAFRNCTNLISITIPDNVTTIGHMSNYINGPFAGCSSLTTVNMSNNVTGIGYLAFIGCTSLSSITLSTGLITIQADAFNGASNLLSIVLPNSLQYLGGGAFANCTKLVSVTLPTNSLFTSLNTFTFYACSALANITIPSTVTSIGYVDFVNCTSLKSISIPSSVTNIGQSAFEGCSSLASVYFYGTQIPISSSSNQFAGISATATAYYLYGTSITYLQARNWFANYVIFNANALSYPCFKSDSLILTISGYKRVQNLKKGDLVKTAKNGFLKIDMIGKKDIIHPASSVRITNQLYKCSQPEYPDIFEPLVLTGFHSILVDYFTNQEQKEKTIEVNGHAYLTDNKYRLPACVDDRTTVYEIPGTYTIYHLALENPDYYMNYGIYANGLLVESCSKRYLKELSNMELI
jgi:hypothetical protein